MDMETRQHLAQMVVGDSTGYWFMCDRCGQSYETHRNRSFALSDAYAHVCPPETGVVTSQTTEYGDREHKYRVWVCVNAPGIMEHHYFGSVPEAVVAVAHGLGDGAEAAGLEERDGTEWVEYSDDRGCDLDELVEEWRERAGRNTIQDVLDLMA